MLQERFSDGAIELDPFRDFLRRKILELRIEIVPTRFGRAAWKHREVMIEIIIRERRDVIGRGMRARDENNESAAKDDYATEHDREINPDPGRPVSGALGPTPSVCP